MKTRDTNLQLGCRAGNGSTEFRLYFPGAASAECLVFEKYDDSNPVVHTMQTYDQKIWELDLEMDLTGRWYQYRVTWPDGARPRTPYADQPFADPYSRHVTTRNHYRQEAKTLITDGNYDWGEDTFVSVRDPRDLIIYETHIEDMVGHDSSESSGQTIYEKWLDPDQKGGIPHLKRLGVNAVEFLPLQKFPPFEPPFGQQTEEGYYNSWNPYARNYWGYMTSFFFAPETIYSETGSGVEPGGTAGATDRAASNLKDIVKLLHSNGIAVIMDVVYNHTSLFDVNPLCHHMPDIFLRHDENGKRMNRSGTGNEINSEHPAARKLITDSIDYWMEEYHIDGFRFDLAGLLDEKSWNVIRQTALARNPDALLIAEPWGGRYVPYLFSNHKWASWNDRFRNGIKGSDPVHDTGFIFSGWHNGGDRHQLENWFQGTIRNHAGGLFKTSEHTVNYLESHDGYTLGDFIRIASKYEGENPVIKDRENHVRLSMSEMKTAKLGAFCLMVTPGITMIHAGQEFGRSKIITEAGVDDPESGRMDYNSYNKGNHTNWLNFDDLTLNSGLFTYYHGLIEIRRESAALRKSDPDSILFESYHQNALNVCYCIDGKHADDLYDYYIAINPASFHSMDYTLPDGIWEILADPNLASIHPIGFTSGRNTLPAKSATLLRRLRH